jgi:hypothetical protein
MCFLLIGKILPALALNPIVRENSHSINGISAEKISRHFTPLFYI